MAEKRPLCSYSGEVKELQAGDSIGASRMFTAGEILVAGDLCRLHSDGKMWRANASAETTVIGLLGISPGSLAAEDSGAFTIFGDASGFTLLTPYAECYIGLTSGSLTTTQPPTVGDFIRVVGYALTATTAFINPSPVWIEKGATV